VPEGYSMFSRMLVPLDGSRLAESVLGIVERLGRLTGCAVTLLHVIEKAPPFNIHGDTHLREAREAERYLRTIAERLRACGLSVDMHVHTVPLGDIPRSIAEHAAELDQDLVVLCTHGRGGVKRFVFGSNAEQVVTHGLTPVLLVRADEAGAARVFGPDRILIPVEPGAPGEAAVRAGAEMARLAGGELYLLSIVPTPASVSAEEAATGRFIPRTARHVLEMAAEEAAVALAGEIERLAAAGIKVGGRVERGEAAAVLVECARKVDADLVVMATKGPAGLGAFWANAPARKVAAQFDGPLLLIRAPEEPGRQGRVCTGTTS